mgnify:CR=1 FL=1
MWLLDKKDGKFWWKEFKNGEYQFISKEQNEKYWADMTEQKEKIVAEIFNRHFNLQQ